MLHSEFMLSQRPNVSDARDARAWLRALPLTDARAAHHAIEAMLAEFEENGVAVRDRLEILETIRPQRIEIDAQYALRYTGKALPLSEGERNAYKHATSLWQKLENAYWYCARAAASGESSLRPHLALCLARAADLACERIKGALRAGQVLDGTIQAVLAQYAGFAREHGVLTTPVADSAHPRRAVSLASVQQRSLLIAMTNAAAGGLTGRERESAFELASLWEAKLALTWLPAGLTRALSREDLPPAADPAKQRIRIVRQGGQIYFLDVTALSRSLRKRIHLLGLGKDIKALALPDSFPASGAAKLLARLHGAWCEEEFGRRHPRTAPVVVPGAERAGAMTDLSVAPCTDNFDAMFCLVAGEPFTANDDSDLASRARFNEMFVFQGAGHARRDKQMRDAHKHIEAWRLADHSAAGARLTRPGAGAHGGRYKPGHLVALRSTARGAEITAQWAEVRWCSEHTAGAPALLEAGVEVLARAPAGVAIRLTGINVAGARHWTSAFLAGSGASGHMLITPAGWYKPGRTIEMREMRAGKPHLTRWLLGPLKRRGADFESIEATLTA